METITSKQLRDKQNQETCECGNKTIVEYSWNNEDGETTCPLCMVAWQSEQIKALKQLIYDLSSKTREYTAWQINVRYAGIMGVDMEYFTDQEMDFSKP